ncbi:hypothetical protein POTOM_030767 [Populus tomentosa]|uniref:CCHC-type domain-containing protein n=1 Tax=Populus tomentosa TaxID=118781 RepID=A0A8X7ZBG5_POPTO|nr:hypothetical protein POTOM_030767 [Populus tomentosa]
MPKNPYAHPGSDKCYRCGQPRHCSNQCPKRSTVNLIELEEECIFDTEKDDNEAAYTYEEEEVIGGDKGELLSLKNYADEVTYDVVEMDACHIILGLPLQYDVDATYRGRNNVYIFMKRGLKVILGLIKEEFASIKPKPQGKPVLLVDEGKFIEETKEAREIFVVVVKGEVERDSIDIPSTLLPLLEEF